MYMIAIEADQTSRGHVLYPTDSQASLDRVTLH